MDWFPWFPEIYKADTMHLTCEQDGMYRRLIDHYMETRQPLPDNDFALSRIVGASPDSWAMAAAIVRAFFIPDGKGGLQHKRCNTELDRQDDFKRKNSEKGKKGAEKRWKGSQQNQSVNSSGYSPAIAVPMPGDSTGQDKTREKKVKKEPSVPKKSPQGTRFEIEVIPEEWFAFCQNEKPMRDPVKIFQVFRDYWIAQPGQKGVKTDWFATFRNWVRKENDHEQSTNNSGRGEKRNVFDKFVAGTRQAARNFEPPEN